MYRAVSPPGTAVGAGVKTVSTPSFFPKLSTIGHHFIPSWPIIGMFDRGWLAVTERGHKLSFPGTKGQGKSSIKFDTLSPCPFVISRWFRGEIHGMANWFFIERIAWPLQA
jgi:hypothetical protein